jgi:hypothetical protein
MSSPLESEDIDWWSLISNKKYLKNPYQQLKELQKLGPIHLDKKTGIYFVLGHHEFGLIARSS